jgi:hypothetical protein
LRIEAPASVPPGAAFPIAVRASDAWSGQVMLQAGADHLSLTLHRGAGTVRLKAPASEADLTLHVSAGARETQRSVHVSTLVERALSGELAPGDLSWDGKSDVRITGVVRVPAGQTLQIAAGARVLLAANARLEILGTLEASGSELAPVLFLPAEELPWGELDLEPGSTAKLSHVLITGGGGDATRAFGHSKSQPMLRVSGARLALDHGLIADAPGKAFGATQAEVTLADTLIAHVDTGGEFERTLLRMTRTHSLEIPDADGVVSDDDNDGVYIVTAYRDAQGKEQSSVLEDVVFAVGEDDGIDHNDSLVRVERAHIQGFRHEGIATSGGQQIEIRDVDVSGCEQGIELGYGAPAVSVVRAYLHDNDVGLRVGDSYDRPILGHMTVRDSVIARNGMDVRNYSNELMAPVPDALDVRCSFLGAAGELSMCNASGEPANACALAAGACQCAQLTLDACR